jgi:hypothetical protein
VVKGPACALKLGTLGQEIGLRIIAEGIGRDTLGKRLLDLRGIPSMRTLWQGLSFLLFMIFLMPSMASAQEVRVIVPDHPTGIPVNGCFSANRTIFGPYNFSFCLERRGTYSVRGGGVRCDGRITWRASGRDIHVNVQRASCGGGVAWEAATMDCRSVGGLLGRLAGRVLDIPRLSSLRCTYYPTVRHQRPVTFTANRT